MSPVFSPEVFVLGVAVGVLGLVLLFSLIIAYAQMRRPHAPLASQF